MSTHETPEPLSTINTSGITDAAGGGGPRPHRHRRRLIKRATISVACLAGVGGMMLAAPAIASATVDQTSAPYAELGPLAYTGNQASQVTAVYTIQNLAEPNDLLLEDNGNATNNGALTDVWDQTNQGSYQDPAADQNGNSYGPITQANELWEFVPDAGNTGNTIITGFGELINRQSGLCLDVNGSDPNEYGDGATVDQWACGGGPNQEWTSLDLNQFPGGSGYTLMPESDNGAGELGVGNSTCAPQGDGDQVYIRTTGLASNPCDAWNIQQASYDFATHPISVADAETDYDGRTYDCATGYWLRVNSYDYTQWYYDDYSLDTGSMSTPAVNGDANDGNNPNAVQGGEGIQYSNPGWPVETDIGQVILYCDPGSTNP
jgi:hypothetical protein